MAEIITLARNLFEVGIQYFLDHKIIAALLILFFLFSFGAYLREEWDILEGELKPIARFLVCLYIGISLVFSAFLLFVFAAATDVYKAKPELFTTKLYILFICISVVDVVFKGFIALCVPAALEKDDPVDFLNGFLQSCIVVVISLVFIFTDFESGIIDWGFTIFGRTIGGWIFNFYSGWALWRFLRFVQYILQIPFMLGISMAADDD